MISIARTFGAPETVPAGKPATSASSASCAGVEPAVDVRDDVHDVAVVFEEELVGDLDRADLGDAADVVAAEVEQHQVLGALLGVGEQLVGERAVVLGRRAARPGAGDRADGDLAVAHPDQDLGARADDREAAEIEDRYRKGEGLMRRSAR